MEDVDKIAHNKIEDQFSNSLKVDEYYRYQLYKFLLTKLEEFNVEVDDRDKYYLFTDYNEGKDALKKIIFYLVDKYGGIDKFNNMIQEYNQYVLNNYLTNEQIVE